MIKKIGLIVGLLVLAACTPNETLFKSTVPVSEPPSLEERVVKTPVEALPKEINFNVPFFPQAPNADWSLPWQEACEEAAVTLAYHYASDKPVTKEQFENELLGLVDWQNEYFGDYKHTNIAQTAEMLKGYFGFSDYTILDNPSVEDLKKELAQGYIIVAPFAGRQLKNPFYKGEGPLYHMMVLRGYDEKNFITNDVGTKRGEDFIYPYERIMGAMHEWHDADINLGAKRVIVLTPIVFPDSGRKMEK